MMEKDSLHIGSSIQRLDPLLNNLMSGCSMQTVQSLKEILPTVDHHALQKIHPYLLVPMLGELGNRKLGNEVKTALLSCMNEILTRINISSLSAVHNILQTLMMEVYDKESPTMIKNVPEEMKLGIMDCALSTVRRMSFEVQDQFYVKQNIPEICQIAYTCLEIAVTEKMRPLRTKAMEVVIALQQIPLEGPDKRSPWERQVVADIFQFILPGACSKLITIVSGDVTQGSKVLMTAIFTLSSMIALVMEDYIKSDGDDPVAIMAAIVELSKTSDQTKKPEDNKELTPCHSRDAKKVIEASQGRTPEWRKKIATHLLPYLEKLGAQCQHSNFKVCKMVAQSCSLILQRCPVSLKEGLSPLLDAIVVLSVHENDEVREEGTLSLKQLQNYFYDQNGYDFIQLAEENFYMLLTRLPRLVQEGGSTQGAASIALLSGYVQLLRPSIQNILSSAAHLQRLVLSLLHVVTLECSSINVGNEHSMRQLVYERYADLHVPWTRLRVSEERSVLTNIQQLFHIVCEKSVGVFDIVCCQLMETLNCLPHFKKESVLLLNLLLLSASHMKNCHAFDRSISLLELYLAPDFLESNKNLRSVATISVIQQDIAIECLLVEGIGCCIEVMGKDRAQAYLLQVLYPLLERAGSANECVSFAGRRALSRVADTCGFESDLVSLISNNMDYLSHCMSVRLRHVNEHMGVFDALSLILHHSSSEIAEGLSKIVQNVLHQSSDVTQSKNYEAHLRVFLTFTLGVQQLLKPNPNCSSDACQGFPCTKLDTESSPEDIILSCGNLYSRKHNWTAVQKLKTYQQNLLLDSNSGDLDEEMSVRDPSEELPPHMQPHNMAEDINDEGGVMDAAQDTKAEVPELAKLLELVLRRCLLFLPSSVTDHQFLAMRTLEIGIQTLEPFTDVLLPIVHCIWSPLIGRFDANQPPLIIRTAFQLLLAMSKTAKDFLLPRIIREVFPQVNRFLKNAVGESHLKDRASAYRFSQKYKTQLALLSGLGPLSCHLNLRGQDFHCLLSVCLLYLSCWQPRPLQAAAVSLITSLHNLDSDAVWWALVSWWTPPHLASVLELPQPTAHGDCEANVRLLLGI